MHTPPPLFAAKAKASYRPVKTARQLLNIHMTSNARDFFRVLAVLGLRAPTPEPLNARPLAAALAMASWQARLFPTCKQPGQGPGVVVVAASKGSIKKTSTAQYEPGQHITQGTPEPRDGSPPRRLGGEHSAVSVLRKDIYLSGYLRRSLFILYSCSGSLAESVGAADYPRRL